jgi:hypothetical protein
LTDLYVWATGQSNIAYEFTQYSAAGRDAFNAEAALYFSTVQNRNKSVGGSTLAEWVDGEALEVYGTALLTDVAANPPIAGAAVAIRFNWGEANVSTGDSKAKIVTELTALFAAWYAQILSEYGVETKIFLDILGDRGTNTSEPNFQAPKEAFIELIDTIPYVYRGSERYDQTRADAQHYDKVAYETQAQRAARRIAAEFGLRSSAGTLGPRLLSAVIVNPSTVTVTITHDAGTDITPTDNTIEGLDVAVDGTIITTPTATYVNGTTINLSIGDGLAATDADDLDVYNNYGQQVGLTKAKVIRDNASVIMPLQTGVITAVHEDPLMTIAGVVEYWDAWGSVKTAGSDDEITALSGLRGSGITSIGTGNPEYDPTLFGNKGGLVATNANNKLASTSNFTGGAVHTVGFVYNSPDNGVYSPLMFFGNSGGTVDQDTRFYVQTTDHLAWFRNQAGTAQNLFANGTGINILIARFNSSGSLDVWLNDETMVNIDPRDDYNAGTLVRMIYMGDGSLANVGTAYAAGFHATAAFTNEQVAAIMAMWNNRFAVY